MRIRVSYTVEMDEDAIVRFMLATGYARREVRRAVRNTLRNTGEIGLDDVCYEGQKKQEAEEEV